MQWGLVEEIVIIAEHTLQARQTLLSVIVHFVLIQSCREHAAKVGTCHTDKLRNFSVSRRWKMQSQDLNPDNLSPKLVFLITAFAVCPHGQACASALQG